MKKTFALLVIFVLIFSLYSCATVQKDLELSQESANIQAIEIYKPDRSYNEGDIHIFIEENEPVAALDSELFATVLDGLSNLRFEEEKVFFPIPMDGGYDYDGYMIAIKYSDGSYDIIAEGGSYSYAVGSDGQGKHKYNHSDYCGDVAWSDFVEQYIEK